VVERQDRFFVQYADQFLAAMVSARLKIVTIFQEQPKQKTAVGSHVATMAKRKKCQARHSLKKRIIIKSKERQEARAARSTTAQELGVVAKLHKLATHQIHDMRWLVKLFADPCSWIFIIFHIGGKKSILTHFGSNANSGIFCYAFLR